MHLTERGQMAPTPEEYAQDVRTLLAHIGHLGNALWQIKSGMRTEEEEKACPDFGR